MKKSECFHTAMLAVLDSKLDGEVKLEVLEALSESKSTAEWSEKREEEVR